MQLLTDKALEELRQERHDDYVAEAHREHMELCLARAVAWRRMDAESRRFKFTFISSMLKAQHAIDQLDKHRARVWKRSGFNDTPLSKALTAGICALETEVDQCAGFIREHGDLLFAFEGTTVLQGGA